MFLDWKGIFFWNCKITEQKSNQKKQKKTRKKNIYAFFQKNLYFIRVFSIKRDEKRTKKVLKETRKGRKKYQKRREKDEKRMINCKLLMVNDFLVFASKIFDFAWQSACHCEEYEVMRGNLPVIASITK